jgi:hypothetical protein
MREATRILSAIAGETGDNQVFAFETQDVPVFPCPRFPVFRMGARFFAHCGKVVG